MNLPSSRDILLRTASVLFRRRGYAGVGLVEILTAADLPKGSLYYHFPGGKRELAEAATRWGGAQVAELIEHAFMGAPSFGEGVARLSMALAQVAHADNFIIACPVLSILQSAGHEPALRAVALETHHGWTALFARHATRLSLAAPQRLAREALMRVQGAWVMAYAEQSTAAFIELAALARAGSD